MSSVATTALRGRVVTPHEILDDGLVVVTDRHIAWVGRAQDARGAGFGRALEAASPAPEGGEEQAGQVRARTQSVDELLDQIDSVLEANAEAFVQGFVQKGGQ